MADWHRTYGSGIDPRLLEILAEARARTGLPFEISSGIRTPEEQRKLLEQGYSTTMRSYHLPQQGTDLAAAADLYLGGDYKTNEEILNAYRPIAEAAKQIAAEKGYGNFTWGGDWKSFFDPYHFQLGGKSNPSMRLSTKDATMTPAAGTDVVDQMKKSPGGVKGVLDFASQVNPETGLSRFQQFAAALDPLIMPEMRAGQAIRATGAERVKTAKTNKTIEWLKNNGYAEIAAALEINPEGTSNVMSSILSEKMKGPDTKVVDGKLVNAKTGEVIYQGDAEKLKTLDEKQVTIVRNLSNDLLKSYKIYDEVANGYGLIASAIKNKSGVDDYVLTVAFAKILDPESVVRESEQAAVARSGGAIDAFVKDVQNFIAGTGSLPESVRSRISSTAQQRAKFYFDKAKGEYDRAVRTAKYSGINESVINDVIPKPTPMPSIAPISEQPTTPPPDTQDTRTQSAKDAGVSLQEWNAMSAEDKKLFP